MYCILITDINFLLISRCYECGETGHLSYSCPQNLLGDRDPPKKKGKKRKHEQEKTTATNKGQKMCDEENEEDDSDENFEDESLSAAIKYQVLYSQFDKLFCYTSSPILS